MSTGGARTRPVELAHLATDILRALEVPADDAALVADTLVSAELWGHSSHGMLRLPWYAERLRSGAMSPVAEVEVLTDTGALVSLDAHDGIGQVVADQMTTLGVERARKHGISGVAVRRSNHFGMAAYYTRRAAEAGCVSLLFTNASPAMPPWGGREKLIGTNPWSIAAPAGRHGVAVMDLANTAVARGKVYLAAERGENIPQDWALDRLGRPTQDPRSAIEGLILPMAGPKGYVISFMVDVLAGVLTGSSFGSAVTGPYDPTAASGCGHLAVTLDIDALGPSTDFGARMEQLIDEVKSVERAEGVHEIYFPGEIEDRSHARMSKTGITLPETTATSLAALADEVGVAVPPTLQRSREKESAP